MSKLGHFGCMVRFHSLFALLRGLNFTHNATTTLCTCFTLFSVDHCIQLIEAALRNFNPACLCTY